MKPFTPFFNKSKTPLVVLIIAIIAIALNGINFGGHYFSNAAYFLLSTSVSFLGFFLLLLAGNAQAKYFKKRFPAEKQLNIRLILVISAYLVTTLLFLLALFNFFEALPYFDYTFDESAFAWSYLALGILTIFLTFFMEGYARYNEWRLNCLETEELNQAYTQSQINALKSQVNPHFLFNSLNALSSLIQDDEEKAETFLDEMSKVYRYMLRPENEPLVTLETELKFVQSYMHLLNARYGEGLQILTDIHPEDKYKFMAPLSLQVLIENAFTQNEISKASPLVISICSDASGTVQVRHQLQPKTITGTIDFEEELDNLLRKYELLNKPFTVDDTTGKQRVVHLPLIDQFKERAL